MGKTTLTVLGLILAALVIEPGPAQAQNYPWCAQKGDGSRSCGFVSYEQCMAVAASRFCERNYLYQPPTAAPPASRRRRGRF